MNTPKVVLALIGAVLLAATACGGDDAVVSDPTGDQARCVQDATDCDDTPGDDAPDPASACLVGATDCNDTPDDTAPEADGSMNSCAPGVPDCNDIQDDGDSHQGVDVGEPNGSDPDSDG